MSPPSTARRRELLTALGVAAATTAAGCLDPTPVSETPDGGSSSTTGDSASTETGSPTTDTDVRTTDTDVPTGADVNSPTAATPTEPPRDGPDPFYVENHRSGDRCVSLSVRNDATEEVVLDGTYTVPGAKGIAFEAVGAVGESFVVEAILDTGERVDEDWEVRVCPPEFRGTGLNNAGLLRIDDDVRFVSNECDFVVVDRPETYEWDPEESNCTG